MWGKPYVIAEGTNDDIDTEEEDVVVIEDINLLTKSQFTIFVDYVLGTHTGIELRFYFQGELGGDWYSKIIQHTSDGSFESYVWSLDSGTPAERVAINFEVSACYGFKVTAKGVGGANGEITAKVVTRNN